MYVCSTCSLQLFCTSSTLQLFVDVLYKSCGVYRRLSLPTFKQLVSQLPTDHFVENLPQSLPILEAFYSKLFLAGGWTSSL